jgi:DNA invertase Pin-like site-specific DNA recombinase
MAVALYSRAQDKDRDLLELREWAAREYPGNPTRDYHDAPGVKLFEAPEFARLRDDILAGKVRHVVSFDADAISHEFTTALDFVRSVIRKRVDVLIPG